MRIWLILAILASAACSSSQRDPGLPGEDTDTTLADPDPSTDDAPATDPDPATDDDFPGPVVLADVDVGIYGATPGGVAAAYALTVDGYSVVLLEPSGHIGGLTTGGLGYTDVGIQSTITGQAKDFYLAVGALYAKPAGTMVTHFEPHVAQAVYAQWLEAADVRSNVRVTGVTKSGARITELATDDGVFRARVFIDATYEGDLLPLAGVSFMSGREANSAYAEAHNGVRGVNGAHQFVVSVDPYVVPGDPTSGRLPFVGDSVLAVAGTADALLQAYNYRLCVTTVPANRVTVDAPADYSPAQYELLGRYVAARVDAGQTLTRASFLNLGSLPNGKYDANNNGGFSTDFIGGNAGYLEASAADRAVIAKAHEDYIRGMFAFLRSDARVPAAVRQSFTDLGLCADEFTTTGNWPPPLYVREGRRMRGVYVMTESDVNTTVVTDGVALGSYNMDTHNAQRFVSNGVVKNEGDVQTAPAHGAYAISYRALTPSSDEATNLLVPVALSATHIAFGSIRMEPVFMMLGSAAAKAAELAIENDSDVQAIDVDALQTAIEATGQLTAPPL